MNILIRTDASVSLGSGHVMRCLTLANELHDYGSNVTFICRQDLGHMIQFIQSQGFKVHILTGDPSVEVTEIMSWLTHLDQSIDWFIVDHYGWDSVSEQPMRKYADKIMVIDDLANRVHDCDILLDQNLIEGYLTRYNDIVPSNCKLFLGPEHAIIRQEFISLSQEAPLRKGKVKRLMVFFSGSDPTNETIKTLYALNNLNLVGLYVDVIVGESNLLKEKVEIICNENDSFHFHCQINYMADLMRRADLSIGAGGTATWERCIMGLPTIVIGIASNQMETIKQLEASGAIKNLGWYEDVQSRHISEAVLEFVKSGSLLFEYSKKAKQIMGIRTSPCENLIFEITGDTTLQFTDNRQKLTKGRLPNE